MNRFNSEIENIFASKAYLVIAVSSGPDSMCLLDIISKKNKKIVVAHVNYHRRKQSNIEAKYLSDYCQKKGIIFESIDVKKYNKGNFQKEARDIRYNFFAELLKKYNTKYLFTAHHADDLVETILMRISRGSTLAGYAGFKQINIIDDYYIIRPLINWSKNEIIDYNQKNKIKYFIDKSNLKNDYTRNKYRNKIIPAIKKENEKIHLKYLKYSECLIEADQYINEMANIESTKVLRGKEIDLIKFNKLHEVIQKRIIMKILEEIYNEQINLINSTNIKNIFSLVKSTKSNVNITLPKHLQAIKSYDKLIFEFKNNDDYNYSYILTDKIELTLGKILRIDIDKATSNNYCIKVNSQNIKLPIIVRNYKSGDKIEIKNSVGHTKVNRIFIDNKINTDKRKIWPIVTDSNNNILWIPGIKKTKYDEVNNYDIVLKFIEKRKENANKK